MCVCVPGSSALSSLPGDFDECSSLTTTRLEAEGEGAGNAGKVVRCQLAQEDSQDYVRGLSVCLYQK